MIKTPQIVFGFALTALGLVVMLRSGLGMGPWGALEVGIAARSGLTLGQVAQLVSLTLILVAWALKIPPSLVTLANMLLIGYFMDIFMPLVPEVSGWLFRIPSYLLGLAVYCFGISFYLIASGGASGPREGTMLGVSRAFGTTIKTARIGIDLFALLLAAPSVVFCSPIYFYALPSQCKTWIDRSQRFWEARRKGDAWLLAYPERQGFACLMGGQPSGQRLFDGARLTLKYFLVNFGIGLAEPVAFRGKDERGDLEADPLALDRALALGREAWAAAQGALK